LHVATHITYLKINGKKKIVHAPPADAADAMADAAGERLRYGGPMTGDRGPSDPKTGAGGKAARVEARLRARYPEVQYVYVQYLSEHLADCAREFDGDLSQLLVLAVLGQERLEAVVRDGLSAAPSATSATRIADVTGLPRETVRRKLLLLEAKGWIARVDGAAWALQADGTETQARRELADLDARGIARLARLYVQLERLLQER
jgi:hypothetical protein